MSIKDKFIEKKEKAKQTINSIQLIVTYIGILFFIFSSITSIIKGYNDSVYFPYILGLTGVYIVIFIIFVFINANKKDKLKNNTKEFKATFKFIKNLLSLVFDLSALFILLDSISLLQNSVDVVLWVKTIIAGIVLLWKIVMLLRKIKKFIKNKKKALKKNSKKKAEEPLEVDEDLEDEDEL